jgi:hypothetical protein
MSMISRLGNFLGPPALRRINHETSAPPFRLVTAKEIVFRVSREAKRTQPFYALCQSCRWRHVLREPKNRFDGSVVSE